MTSIFAGKTPLIVLISLLTATPLAAQTVLEKAARDETPVWPIPIPPWRPPCARRNRRWRIFSKSPQRQGRARRASLSKLPFAKVSASNIFGLRLLPIPSFPARSIIRRAWFTLKLGQTITFAQSDIVDWLYIENGMMRGNYTACALLISAPKNEAEEFKKTFGLSCDF